MMDVTDRNYNFSAGPAAVPLSVLRTVQSELLCYPGAGASILEISHRSPDFSAILEEVELAGMENRRVETLSGGQRQRTAIARALMQDADVILADEPVSALDPELAEDALELMVECVARRNVTLLVNLHQPDLAARFASRFIGLANGRLVYDGPPSGFTEKDAELVYRGKPSEKQTGDSRQDDRLAQDLEAADRRPGLHLVGD